MARRRIVTEEEVERAAPTRVIKDVPELDIDMGVITPVDRIRWGPILAGVVTALSTLVILSLLGLAIGLTVYDASDPASNFGLGAGLWGIISAVLAFIIGGAIAGYTAAVPTQGDGMLNGAMVWLVTIPLMVYLLGAGIGSLLSAAGNLVETGVSATAPLVTEAGVEETLGLDAAAVQATAEAAGTELTVPEAQATADAFVDEVAPEPQQIEEAAETAAPSVWGTLLALLLGLAAAALGGLFGARGTQPGAVRTVRT
ncbi:MAG TPA: hypothetical protein VF177_03895 [Anaerolineae bacterium]